MKINLKSYVKMPKKHKFSYLEQIYCINTEIFFCQKIFFFNFLKSQNEHKSSHSSKTYKQRNQLQNIFSKSWEGKRMKI